MKMKGVVYGPPAPGLPHVAVIFYPGDEVFSARSVPSLVAGEDLIAQVLASAQTMAQSKP